MDLLPKLGASWLHLQMGEHHVQKPRVNLLALPEGVQSIVWFPSGCLAFVAQVVVLVIKASVGQLYSLLLMAVNHALHWFNQESRAMLRRLVQLIVFSLIGLRLVLAL